MFNFNEVLLKSVGIYLVACFGLYKIKHPKMFKSNGEFRSFGLNKNKDETTTPFWLITTLVGLSTYYLLLVQQGNFVK